MPLSNYQLENIARDLRITLKDVVMKDELPTERETGNWIINLESEGNHGSHWVCLIVCDNFSFYFDSFGQLMPTEVIDFCKDRYHPLYYNAKEIQDMDSSLCGFYCIGFFKYLMEHKTNIL